MAYTLGAYFRALKGPLILAARKTQYNVHFVDIIPWPQAAMAARRMRSGFLRRAQKPLYAQYNVHFVDIIPWPQAATVPPADAQQLSAASAETALCAV